MRDKRGSEIDVLSVVVPCFNEARTLELCITRLLDLESPTLSVEIIIVDDASTDTSNEIANRLSDRVPQVRLFRHNTNQGKGAALRTGFQHTSGHFVAVQDADLEYDPRDLLQLIKPLQNGTADVVFGSRFPSYGSRQMFYSWHSMGNAVLTFVSNVFSGLDITDMETCYKVFRHDVIEAIKIEENRFGVEPEIVAKVAQMQLRVCEMGISYRARGYKEGKKIGVKDGFRALYAILRYNLYKTP